MSSEREMPIGRGGGIAFVGGEAEGESLAVAPVVEAPASEEAPAEALEIVPVTSLSDGWALGS